MSDSASYGFIGFSTNGDFLSRKKIIAGQVQEFARFRNELFHDRHNGKTIKFNHLNFSSIPIFSSQVDVIQALQIVLEVTSMLRYALNGLDTMPSAPILHKGILVWEKIDIIYEQIIGPYFNMLL